MAQHFHAGVAAFMESNGLLLDQHFVRFQFLLLQVVDQCLAQDGDGRLLRLGFTLDDVDALPRGDFFIVQHAVREVFVPHVETQYFGHS